MFLKYHYYALILVIVLVACGLSSTQSEPVTHNTGTYEEINHTLMIHYSYNGHDYLEYNGGRSYNLLHDPDCAKCRKLK